MIEETLAMTARLECLRLAHADALAAGHEDDELIKRARLYADFVLGANLAETMPSGCNCSLGPENTWYGPEEGCTLHPWRAPHTAHGVGDDHPR